MDWMEYAKSLEDIIARIDLPEERRIVVDAFVENARKRCLTNDRKG